MEKSRTNEPAGENTLERAASVKLVIELSGTILDGLPPPDIMGEFFASLSADTLKKLASVLSFDLSERKFSMPIQIQENNGAIVMTADILEVARTPSDLDFVMLLEHGTS